MPDEPEVLGLLALMLLTESRRAARTSADGALVLLADQDRTRWDRALIAEGQAIVRQCLRRGQPGPYQIQAAINAVHSDAPIAAATDWDQILRLYDQLLAVAPGPVVALNRAVAVAEVDGPAAALTLVDGLDLDGYYLFHAIRADLLRRLDRRAEAEAAYETRDRPERERGRARAPNLAKERAPRPDWPTGGPNLQATMSRPPAIPQRLRLGTVTRRARGERGCRDLRDLMWH